MEGSSAAKQTKHRIVQTRAILVLLVLLVSIYCFAQTAVRGLLPNWAFPPFHGDYAAARHLGLGAEYRCIAQSLLQNYGFAAPFCSSTEPTAWMAPLLPALLAILMWSTNSDILLTATLIVGIKTAIIAWVVDDIYREGLRRGAGTVAVLSILINMIAFSASLFQQLHDGWLLLFVVHLITRSYLTVCRDLEEMSRWRWGLLGGTCGLASPTMLLAWGALSLYLASVHRSLKPAVAISIVVAAMVASPWTIRNYLVFGRLVPVKSNGWFEFNQSLQDPDGVLDASSLRDHPYNNPAASRRYSALGENAFLDEARQSAIVSIREKGFFYWLNQCANRLAAATVIQPALHPIYRTFVWYQITAVAYAIPLLVWAGSQMLRPGWQPGEAGLAVFAMAYLAPYVLVSYYDRYSLPLFGIRVLLMVCACGRLFPQSHAETAPASQAIA